MNQAVTLCLIICVLAAVRGMTAHLWKLSLGDMQWYQLFPTSSPSA